MGSNMSNFDVIDNIEDALKEFMEKEEHWKGAVDPKPTVEFKSPTEGDDNTNTIYFFLYQITENNYLKNEEMQRIDHNHLQRPPMALDLFYLITPFGGKKNTLLGKVMQILQDNVIIYGKDLEKDEDIRILLNPVSLDDLTKIWSAFKDKPFRLSVSYTITPVRIDSTIKFGVQRVVSKEMGYYQMVPKGGQR
jgi:hypothetical protein